MKCEPVASRWNDGRLVIVAAPGPSLTQAVADRCRGHTVFSCKDSYRLMPWAEVMYGCDEKFWARTNGCRDFKGERWSSHGGSHSDDKTRAAAQWGLRLVTGKRGVGFSLDPKFIHYGNNSGFQAINLAILFGATRIVLVGFDMRCVDGNRYFHGRHPSPPNGQQDSGFSSFHEYFNHAARLLPKHISIVNATPDSALKSFLRVTLDETLAPLSEPYSA